MFYRHTTYELNAFACTQQLKSKRYYPNRRQITNLNEFVQATGKGRQWYRLVFALTEHHLVGAGAVPFNYGHMMDVDKT